MSRPSELDPASADARFASLYSDYHTLCYQLAWDVLGHHDQALDTAQEVFLQLLASRPASLDRTLGPAFFRIAVRNQAIRILKRRRVRYAALGRLQVEQESAGYPPGPGL